MEYIKLFIDYFLHLDKHLNEVISNYGNATYLILFLIIFAETGLVVFPILPGDSLLFAAGSFAAFGSLNVYYLSALLTVAAIIGDALNYRIGYMIGPKVLERDSKIFKKEYLEKTEKFYEKYGSKTIIIARFVPIVRTFAPFMAGVGKMSYVKFGLFNIIGGIIWINSFVFAGYFFGNIPVVKNNFTIVILVIIFLSIAVPAAVEFNNARKEKLKAAS